MTCNSKKMIVRLLLAASLAAAGIATSGCGGNGTGGLGACLYYAGAAEYEATGVTKSWCNQQNGQFYPD
jgi:hypothetical protein